MDEDQNAAAGEDAFTEEDLLRSIRTLVAATSCWRHRAQPASIGDRHVLKALKNCIQTLDRLAAVQQEQVDDVCRTLFADEIIRAIRKGGAKQPRHDNPGSAAKPGPTRYMGEWENAMGLFYEDDQLVAVLRNGYWVFGHLARGVACSLPRPVAVDLAAAIRRRHQPARRLLAKMGVAVQEPAPHAADSADVGGLAASAVAALTKNYPAVVGASAALPADTAEARKMIRRRRKEFDRALQARHSDASPPGRPTGPDFYYFGAHRGDPRQRSNVRVAEAVEETLSKVVCGDDLWREIGQLNAAPGRWDLASKGLPDTDAPAKAFAHFLSGAMAATLAQAQPEEKKRSYFRHPPSEDKSRA